MDKIKKIISLCLVCSVLLLSVKFCKVETRADVIAVTGVTTVTVIILGVLSICGVLYLNQDTIATGINGYLDSVYTDYDEYNVNQTQSALNSVLNANNVQTKVIDDEVYDEFSEEYNDSIIYSRITKSGRVFTLYQGGQGGAPEPSHFDFKPMATFAVGMGALFIVCKSVVDYYSRFFTKTNNSLTINNTITMSEEEMNNIFGKFGTNYTLSKTYADFGNYQNGDIAVRVYYNSGEFDIRYNRPYSTASNNQSYYMYWQGTNYMYNMNVTPPQIRTYSYTDWDNRTVRGNTYAQLRMGCTEANKVLYPFINIGAGEIPYTYDEESPYYIKGIYFFGDYVDLSGLIDPENMPDEWVAPDDMELGEINAYEDLPDDFSVEQFKHYLDNKYPSEFPTGESDKVQVTTPELGELPNTLEYPAYALSALGTNPNLNPDVSPSPAPSPSEVPLPSDEPIETENEDLNNLQLSGFINKFPFCMPMDLYNMISCLEAEPLAPVFRLTFPTPMLERKGIDFVVDLNEYNALAELIRRGELIVFCVGLVLLTRHIIKG